MYFGIFIFFTFISSMKAKIYDNDVKISEDVRNMNIYKDEFERQIDFMLINKKHTSEIERKAKRSVRTFIDDIFQSYSVKRSSKTIKENKTKIDLSQYITQNEYGERKTCINVQDKICNDIKYLNHLKCHDNTHTIILDKLCDGNADCPDKSDEENCTFSVVKKIQYTKQFISGIKSPSVLNCFKPNVKRNLLQQVKFIDKVLLKASKNNTNNSSDKNEIDNIHFKDKKQLKTYIEEVAAILNMFSLSVDSGACFSKRQSNMLYGVKYSFDTEEDDEFTEIVFQPRAHCNCKDQICPYCTNECKHFCLQSYVLSKWACKSTDGNNLISLNSLCDGKIDCYDKSDEKNCTNTILGESKFTLNKTFTNIFHMINQKIKSESTQVGDLLLSLRNKFFELKDFYNNFDTDPSILKVIRNECFSKLSYIYQEIFKLTDSKIKQNEMYTFLLTINIKLVDILKYSSFDNEKMENKQIEYDSKGDERNDSLNIICNTKKDFTITDKSIKCREGSIKDKESKERY